MRKFDGWITALFALVFIAAPAIVGFYFFLVDWGVTHHPIDSSGNALPTWSESKVVLSTGVMWGVAFGFIGYAALITAVFVFTKILAIDALTFVIPITFVLVAIFLTGGMPLWGRALIVVALVLGAFPVNIMVSNLKRWQYKKSKQ